MFEDADGNLVKLTPDTFSEFFNTKLLPNALFVDLPFAPKLTTTEAGAMAKTITDLQAQLDIIGENLKVPINFGEVDESKSLPEQIASLKEANQY